MAGVVILLLLIWGACVALCVNGARNRGRDPVGWGVLALLIGFFALIVLYILPPTQGLSPEQAVKPRNW